MKNTQSTLEQKVKNAIENAKFSTFDLAYEIPQEPIDKARRTKELIDTLNPHDYLELSKFEFEDIHSVSVETPEEYMVLLQIAYRVLGEYVANDPNLFLSNVK